MLTNHTNGQLLYFTATEKHLIRQGVVQRPAGLEAIKKCQEIYDATTGFVPIPDGVGLPLCVACGTCDGSGLVRYEEHTCDVCGGDGHLHSAILGDAYECPACAGDGLISIPRAGGTEPCPDCDGWGMHDDDVAYVLCGVRVSSRYALRVIERNAEFAAITIPAETGEQMQAVAFRTPTASGLICGITEKPGKRFSAREWGRDV